METYAGGDATLGESMRDDAAFSQQVDCSEPHSLELHDVVSLPPALARQVTTYADLLDQDSALYRQVRDEVSERCLAESPYGRAQRRAAGVDVQLSPFLSAASGLHVAWDPFPADLWAKGQQKFVCTFEQDEPGTLPFADLTTRQVPVGGAGVPEHPAEVPPLQREAPGRGDRRDDAELGRRQGADRRSQGRSGRARTGSTSRSATRSTPVWTRSARRCSRRSRR